MTTKLIFYKAKTGVLFDKLVSFFDKGDYSHVEIVLHETEAYWVTVGSSNRDGGVRVAYINKSDHWDVVETQADVVKDLQPYMGAGYDWIGLGRTIYSWWPYCKKRWVCSTFAAEVFGIADPRGQGVEHVYKWALAQGAKK